MKPKKPRARAQLDVQDLREAWQSFYALGDAAIARMKVASASGDVTAAREAWEEFRRAWSAMQRFRRLEDRTVQGMRTTQGARARAAQLEHKGAGTRAQVLLMQAKLRAEGTPERKITKKIAAVLNLSVDTVRGYRK